MTLDIATRNRETVLRLLAHVADAQVEEAVMLVHEDYIENNVNIGVGRAGLRNYLNKIVTADPSPQVLVDRVIAEGDYVVVHLRTLWGRSRPSTSAIDIFKLRDGLIQEHWDVVQELPRNAIVCPAQRPGMTSMEGCAE